MEEAAGQRFRRSALRRLHRLVTDVVRLGDDPAAWTDCLLDGMNEFFDAKFAACASAPLPGHPGKWGRATVSLQRGLSAEETEFFIQGYWAPANAYRSEFLRRSVAIPARFVTVRREDLMSDAEWYASDAFTQIHEPLKIDAQMESHFVFPQNQSMFGLAIHRELGKPPFTDFEKRLLRRLHLELARVWRTGIAKTDAVADSKNLSPRLRDVLLRLCLGRSEKEIAAELSLSPRTIHNHVVRIHQIFNVHSRGELLAATLRLNATEPPSLPPESANQFRQLQPKA